MLPSETRDQTRALPTHRLGRLMMAGLALAVATLAGAAVVFSPDDQPVGWTSRPALTSYNLSSDREVIYRPEYRVGSWAGALYANRIDLSGTVSTSSPWASPNAATLLDAQNWDSGRRIVTRSGSGSNVPFRWARLTTAQQAALGDATSGPRLLNYVRGDRSQEYPASAALRERSTVLGDIQHSSVLHWDHGGGKRRLYVGANDGMLHVFDAANGAEVLAYVPSMLLPRLSRLAARPYVHTLYADGALAISNVTQGSSVKTWLVGALGGGGKGLFMLDMTDPDAADESAAAAKIKWELSPASPGFANLGHSYAAPRLARLAHDVAAVVVGNGYNNGGNGRASLLVIDADSGTLIREIDTGVGSTSSPNGLSTPTLLDSDGDGRVDLVYAGDIDGNLWRFDLSAKNPANYLVTKLLTTAPAQAITVAPVLAPHASSGQLVLFGTGRTLAPADASDTAVHYAYGLWDGAPAANTSWLLQSLSPTSRGSQALRHDTVNPPNWSAGGHRGWKLALPAGERIVGEAPFLNQDRYYFVSTNPTLAAAGADQPAGMNWIHELDFASGGAPARSVFDINGDGAINDGDLIDGRVIAGRQLGAGIVSQPVLVDLPQRSLTLFNWQSNLSYAAPVVTLPTDRGVSGGHFDVDLYNWVTASDKNKTTSVFTNSKHVHEYDDLYDVTGVNFLHASEQALNLKNAITDSKIQFKVLVVNQYLNPAVELSVGGAGFVSVKSFAGQASTSSAATLLANQPSYSTATVNSLAFKLPLTAFRSQDWWGDGSIRAGLIPTQTNCVNDVDSNGAPTGSGRAGLNGERHDGALTLQIINAATPASALELNQAAGGAKYGWRVKAANFSHVLAEYTVFWHHPNGACYGDSKWVANPPQDTSESNAKTKTAATGSSDPKDGSFTYAVPDNVTVVSITTTVSNSSTGPTTTTVTRYSDDLSSSVSVTDNGDGTETTTSTNRGGQTISSRRSVGSLSLKGAEEMLAATRRINWREIVRR
jgi:hypothetical protein